MSARQSASVSRSGGRVCFSKGTDSHENGTRAPTDGSAFNRAGPTSSSSFGGFNTERKPGSFNTTRSKAKISVVDGSSTTTFWVALIASGETAAKKRRATNS